jgi:copper chaperone NosL
MTRHSPHSRSLALALIALSFAAACTREQPPPAAQEITAGTVCALDGMLLNDYPGPKAQIHYNDGTTEFFCDTVEMFSILLRPESRRRVLAVYTQDMGQADWRQPRGHWINARSAWYVQGSKLTGSMGPTFAAFARREDAEAFAGKYGGQVLRFDQVTPQMADLRGGAARDEGM